VQKVLLIPDERISLLNVSLFCELCRLQAHWAWSRRSL